MLHNRLLIKQFSIQIWVLTLKTYRCVIIITDLQRSGRFTNWLNWNCNYWLVFCRSVICIHGETNTWKFHRRVKDSRNMFSFIELINILLRTVPQSELIESNILHSFHLRCINRKSTCFRVRGWSSIITLYEDFDFLLVFFEALVSCARP